MSSEPPPVPPNASAYTRLIEGGGRVREPLLFDLPPDTPEIELQARWFSGEFGRRFRSTDGEAVEIVQFGEWNRSAGPDFIRTAVRVGGAAPRAGAIELDTRAEDWDHHGHATNPAYDGVVLHLFFQSGPRRFFTRNSRHERVPQVRLDPEGMSESPPVDLPPAIRGRCAPVLARLGDESVDEVIRAAARFRLHRKAARLARAVDAHGADQAVYQALATAFGYARNKLPFLLLAQRLPLRLLRRPGVPVESLLFGFGGFLDEAGRGDRPAADTGYLRDLWADWWKARPDAPRSRIDRELWDLAATRPANHPQRRLAALAGTVRRWGALRKALDTGGIAAARGVLESLDHPFWTRHFTLSSGETDAPVALIGDARLRDIETNVLAPFLYLNGRDMDDLMPDSRAPLDNRHVRNAAHRLLADRPELARRLTRSTVGQQGLLEIYDAHCRRDLSDCLQCPFPEALGRADAR